MITLVEALNFRCLRDISRPMDRFHVLVGPNASGKTTFLDVVAFLSDLVGHGLQYAIETRSPTFQDLLFRQAGERFELAMEAPIPDDLKRATVGNRYDRVRYEVVIELDADTQTIRIGREVLRVLSTDLREIEVRVLFPDARPARQTLAQPTARKSVARTVMTRVETGRANYYSETYKDTPKPIRKPERGGILSGIWLRQLLPWRISRPMS